MKNLSEKDYSELLEFMKYSFVKLMIYSSSNNIDIKNVDINNFVNNFITKDKDVAFFAKEYLKFMVDMIDIIKNNSK